MKQDAFHVCGDAEQAERKVNTGSFSEKERPVSAISVKLVFGSSKILRPLS